jgi:anti-sigma factor RsiW
MSHKCTDGDSSLYVVSTTAECTDPSVGDLIADYILGGLTPEQREVFERHQRRCEYCRFGVRNWSVLMKALTQRDADQRSTRP